jgi:chromosomal replication initiator protein
VRDELLALLPPEIAEVVAPVLTVRVRAGRLAVGTTWPMWRETVDRLVLPAARQLAAAHGLEVAAPVAAGAGADGGGFAAFLEDPGNRLALAACRACAAAPGVEHNPIVIHGPPGCGKSHLVAAVVAALAEAAGPEGAVAIDGDALVAAAGSLAAGGVAAYDQAVVVAVDGLDAVAGRDLAQEALFQLINRCLDRGAQVLVAARQPPARLGLQERLASRLAWGLVVPMERPYPETRIALVRRLAGPAAARLPAAELAALVERSAPDGHQALVLAERLGAGEVTAGHEVALDRILAVVAARFGCRPTDITGPRRPRDLVRARQMALMLARRLTGHSLYALGNMVGGRDHATVLHAIREAEARAAADPEWRGLADALAAAALAR